jgi:hypothetical protein
LRTRSTNLLSICVKRIVDAKVQFRSLAEPWADTGTSTGRLISPAQQKEATQRRAEGATLDELARSYNVGMSTIRRASRAPRRAAPRLK